MICPPVELLARDFWFVECFVRLFVRSFADLNIIYWNKFIYNWVYRCYIFRLQSGHYRSEHCVHENLSFNNRKFKSWNIGDYHRISYSGRRVIFFECEYYECVSFKCIIDEPTWTKLANGFVSFVLHKKNNRPIALPSILESNLLQFIPFVMFDGEKIFAMKKKMETKSSHRKNLLFLSAKYLP